jgi:hypothetical protein
MGLHFRGQPIDQIGRVFIDPAGKVVRPDGQRGHVGFQPQHAAAFGPGPRPAAGGELHDHAGAMPGHLGLEFGEQFGVRTGCAIGPANMRMQQAGARLEAGLGCLDLFGDGDRHRRVVGFLRHRTGDRHTDDAGVGHRHLH